MRSNARPIPLQHDAATGAAGTAAGPSAGAAPPALADLAPVTAVILLAVLWSGLWYVSASIADRALAGWVEREAAAGRVYSCGSETIGGFPFSIRADCIDATAEIKNSQPPYGLGAKALRFVAEVYHPTRLVGDVTGPLRKGADLITGRPLDELIEAEPMLIGCPLPMPRPLPPAPPPLGATPSEYSMNASPTLTPTQLTVWRVKISALPHWGSAQPPPPCPPSSHILQFVQHRHCDDPPLDNCHQNSSAADRSEGGADTMYVPFATNRSKSVEFKSPSPLV